MFFDAVFQYCLAWPLSCRRPAPPPPAAAPLAATLISIRSNDNTEQRVHCQQFLGRMRLLSAAACSASVAVAAAVFANSQNSAAAAAAAATAPDAPNYSFCLEKVIVIARHGARSPTIQFPFADSYLDWRLCGNARTLLRAGDERLMAYVTSVPPASL